MRRYARTPSASNCVSWLACRYLRIFGYSNDHEWAKVGDTTVRVGITDYAQDALGDVVFVDLPKVGSDVSVGGVVGEVESTKSVSEIYAPVGGNDHRGE